MQEFKTKEELFKHLKENKEILIAEKKAATKQADSLMCNAEIDIKTDANKADDSNDGINLRVKVVINTTNLLDSHGDVHIPGLWTKTLKDRRKTYLLQEHKMSFDHIITDIVKPSAKMMNWADLGYNYEGQTQALIFDAEIEKGRNDYMREQYSKGYVDNHSVGMQYVKLELAVNSNDRYYADEKAAWDKYITQVANRDRAEEQGYFWAVTEAKLIEGSAVPIGSNYATPTLSVKEPTEVTPKEEAVNINEFRNEIKHLLTKTFTQ